MTTIAMTREMGSLGRDVAIGVAERMGLELIHHEMVEHDIAERLHRPASEVHKYLEGGVSWWQGMKLDGRRLCVLTAEEILEVALRGNVLIRGWGAANLLRDFGHVLRVRICAPMAKREAEIMRRTGLTDRDYVRQEIEQNDAAHARVIERFFGGDWRAPENYDVVLNTERLTVEACVEHIAQLARDARFQETAATRQALADRLTERRLQRALDEGEISMVAPLVNVRVANGVAELNGYVGRAGLKEEVEKLAKATAGIAAVTNNLKAMPRSSRTL